MDYYNINNLIREYDDLLDLAVGEEEESPELTGFYSRKDGFDD